MAKSNATAADAAQWMFEQSKSGRHWLYQDQAVFCLHERSGRKFLYTNKNGNNAIAPAVLSGFRKLCDGRMEWDRGSKAWRPVRRRRAT